MSDRLLPRIPQLADSDLDGLKKDQADYQRLLNRALFEAKPPLEIYDEGTLVDPATFRVNFVGSGVTAFRTSPGQVEVDITGGGTGGTITTQDEGVTVDSATSFLNFVGAGVTATQTSSGHVNVTIPGASTYALRIDDEGTLVDAAATKINFVGAAVVATQSSPGQVQVTVTAIPSPLTTKGDLWGYSTTDARVPVSATNGLPLISDSTNANGVSYKSFTSGSVIFAGSSGELTQDNAHLFWDDANNRLGVGTSAPDVDFHVKSSSSATTKLETTSTSSTLATGVGAYSLFYNSTGLIGTVGVHTSGYSNPTTIFLPNQQTLESYGAGGTAIAAWGSGADVIVGTANGGAAANERLRITSGGNINLFGATTTSGNDVFASKSTNGQMACVWQNTSNGSGAYGGYYAINDAGNNAPLLKTGSGFTTAGLVVAGQTYMVSNAGSVLFGTAGSADLIFVVGGTGTSNEGLRVDSNKNVSFGNAALATNATNGFLYIPTCAGAPSGTPTSKTGRVPIVFDTTNNDLYVYNSGWKKTTTFS